MVERLVLGDFGTCSYVVGEEGERQALVIDPASDSKPILETLAARNWEAHYILNTHGHADHIGGNAAIKRAFPRALLAIGKGDAPMLDRPGKNLSLFFGRWLKSPRADQLLEEGEILKTGGLSFQVMELPGHTPGGVGFFREASKVAYAPKPAFAETPDSAEALRAGRPLRRRREEPPVLFCGDTLFAGGIGRADFPGSSERLLMESITRKILALPDDTLLYPGHGPPTTVAREKQTNPFLEFQ